MHDGKVRPKLSGRSHSKVSTRFASVRSASSQRMATENR